MSASSALRRLAVARAISVAGSEAAYIALIALVLERTGSASWVAAALVAMFVVQALASPVAGLLGDRVDRRRLMIASDLTAAACFCALPLAGAPWLIVLLSAGAAVAKSPFIPASQAAVPNLVGMERVEWANGLLTKYRMVGHLAGPLAGGALVASVGSGGAFLVNAASFALSAALVAGIRGKVRARSGERPQRGLAAGFRHILHDPPLRALSAAYAVFLLGVGTVLVAELPLARSYGVGEIGYGLIVAGWGAGGLVGAALSRRLLEGRPDGLGLIGGMAVMGLGLLPAGVSPWFAPVVAGMLVGGFGCALMEVAEKSLVQRRSPDGIRSRVVAAGDALATVGLGLSFAIGGPLVEGLGPHAAYLLSAAACVVSVAILMPVRETPRPVVVPSPGVTR